MDYKKNKDISDDQFKSDRTNVKKLLSVVETAFPRGDENRRMRLLQMFMLGELYERNLYYEEADNYYNKYIKYSTRYLQRINGSDGKIFEYLEEAYVRRGRRHLHDYCIALEMHRPFEEKFYLPRITVLKTIVDDIEKLYTGELDVLSVSLPPRVGKSTIGLIAITWFAGMHPMENVLGVGYSTGLVNTFYDAVKEFFTSEEYLFNRIFPNSPLVKTNSDWRTLDLNTPNRYATCTFRSIDGALTGAVQATSLAYMDDIVSGIEEAMSPDRMDKLWTKVSVDFMQRVVNSPRTGKRAPMLLIGTRWSNGDALTRFEEHYKKEGGGVYKSYRVPALDIYGKSNFDFGNHAGFTTEYYLGLKKMMDNVSWETVYQQNPIERLGLLFNKADMRWFTKLPEGSPKKVLAFCDLAFGGTDSTAMPVGLEYSNGDVYIIDIYFQQGEYTATLPHVVERCERLKIDALTIESNNGGFFYSDMVRAKCKGRAHTQVRSSRTVGRTSKEARIVAQAPTIKKFYFLDEELQDKMYADAMSELFTFKMEGKNKHDDVADALSLFADKMINTGRGKGTTNKKARSCF